LSIFTVAVAGPIRAEDSSTVETRAGIPVPEIKAYRVNPHPPKIDGYLNDEIWTGHGVNWIGDFTQRDPVEGVPPTESTLVAVAYDDEALYVAMKMFDSEPDKIIKRLVRRDRWADADYIAFRVDPYHDHRTGYEFEVSSAGVMRDMRIYDDSNTDDSWDAVWEVKVAIQPWGWSAEYKIPYHCLRFNELEEHTWGVDFARYVARKEESSRWAYVPIKTGGFTRNFGHLTGINGIKPARHIEILPYVVSQLETEEPSAGNSDGRDILANTGVDLKIGLASNLTLDATINPDFGQVELDEPVLNLTAYETYFDERRPFFMEGSDLFSTPFMLFYSRRIGRQPYQGVNDDDALYYTDYPRGTTILGSGKLTGKITPSTSIAFLTAVTAREKAEYAALTNVVTQEIPSEEGAVLDTISADTTIRSQVVESEAIYSVLRIKKDIFNNSSIGATMAVTGQDSYHAHVVGGLDWRLFLDKGNAWLFTGQAVGSRVDPDDIGYGFYAEIYKCAGQHWRGEVNTTFKSPELQINRLGYTSRSDTRKVATWIQYRATDDWWIFHNTYNNFNAWSYWNYDGINYDLGGNWNAYLEFINHWSLGGGINFETEKYSDDETRGNGIWEWPVVPTFSWWAELNTDERKMFSLCLNPGSGTNRGGHWWAHYTGVEFHPAGNIELEFGVNYKQYIDNRRWVENISTNDGDSSIFADLDMDQMTFSISTSVLLNRNLSFQLSAEGLISGLDYEDPRYYLGSGDYSPVLNDDYNYDYNYSALNSTMLIRWEYMPGSTLYCVWTRSRPEYDGSVNDLDLSRDFDRFFSRGAQNLFLIKASYWLNM